MSAKYHFFLKSMKVTRRGAYNYWGVVPNSYASRVVDRIYDYYFSGAKNVKIEYWKYYRNEFPTFRDFLIKRFNLNIEEAKEFDSFRTFYKEISFDADSHIALLLEDKNIGATLKEFTRGICV